MSGFPRLVPAFTAQAQIKPGPPIGSARSGGLVMAEFVPGEGSFKSEPGYAIQADGVFLHGSDYIRIDTDGRIGRLDVASVFKDNKSGGLVRFAYTGALSLTGAVGPIFAGSPEAKTTEFGECFTHIVLETSDTTLKALNDKVYVGSGRFILEQGKPVTVEYKISEVTY